MRDWRDSGAVIALGSDAPYFPFDPRRVVATAVSRRMRRLPEPLGTEQALTVLEAVEGYTRGAAHAAFAEDRRGMLRAGFLADLVLLSVDPGGCSAEEFAGAQVLRTVVGGRTVHEAAAGIARQM